MSRKVCPVTDRTCTHHGCVVQGEGVCWASGAKHPRPVRTAGEGQALVYTENDVRRAVTTWDGDALATWDHVESFLDHLRQSIEGQAVVFTENDVRAIVSAALAACENPDGGDEAAADAIAEHRGELSSEDTEAVIGGQVGQPMIPREQSDRLVALALVWGASDYEGLPGAVWDGLFKDGLIREAGDQTGERWSVLTDKGEAFLRAELERDR